MKANLKLNRRNLLAGIAAASAAATVAAPASAATESSALLELADALPALSTAHLEAEAKKKAAYRSAMAIWPDAPEGLVSYAPNFLSCRHDYERDITGGTRYPSTDGKHKTVRNSSGVLSSIKYGERDLTRKAFARNPERVKKCKAEIASLKRLAPEAKAYEAECARIKDESNYDAAINAWSAARDALHAHVDAILREPAQSMDGVVIKAQALGEWSKVD